jgi:hypothetical protein
MRWFCYSFLLFFFSPPCDFFQILSPYPLSLLSLSLSRPLSPIQHIQHTNISNLSLPLFRSLPRDFFQICFNLYKEQLPIFFGIAAPILGPPIVSVMPLLWVIAIFSIPPSPLSLSTPLPYPFLLCFPSYPNTSFMAMLAFFNNSSRIDFFLFFVFFVFFVFIFVFVCF